MTVPNWATRLNFAARRRCPGGATLSPLILVTDRHRLPDPIAAAERLPNGSMVLLRDYDAPDRTRLARQLATLCHRRGLKLLIAGDPWLAAAVNADGVHYSEAAARRRPVQPSARRFLVTIACHDAASLRRAQIRGADACLLSPVFPTESHPGARHLGPWRFAKLLRGVDLPVYALGGINSQSVRRLAGSGACGVAAIGAFSASQPRS